MILHMSNEYTPLGKEIQRLLAKQQPAPWTLGMLEEYSNGELGASTVSRMMRGKIQAIDPGKLALIADILDGDLYILYDLAGIPVPPRKDDVSARALVLAQRLDEVPAPVREHVFQAVENTIAAVRLSPQHTHAATEQGTAESATITEEDVEDVWSFLNEHGWTRLQLLETVLRILSVEYPEEVEAIRQDLQADL